ncbi:MAG: hypothetical protein ACRDU8_10220 [Egibacteraceae bacterium]
MDTSGLFATSSGGWPHSPLLSPPAAELSGLSKREALRWVDRPPGRRSP